MNERDKIQISLNLERKVKELEHLKFGMVNKL